MEEKESRNIIEKEEILRNFVDNLERERTKLGITQSRMAEELGMSLSGYKKIVTGKTEKIDLYLGFRLHALSGRYITDLCGLTDPMTIIASRISSLSPRQLEFVQAVVEFEAQLVPDADKNQAGEYITVMVPTGNMEDGMVWDSMRPEKLEVSAYRERFGSQFSCGIKVTGNQFHPVYHRGDVLLISTRPSGDGEIGIFVNKKTGRGYIRKLHLTRPARLEPLTGYGEVFEVDTLDEQDKGQWINFGTILTKIR